MAASRDENNNDNNITKIGSGNMKASSEDLFKAQKMLGGGGHEQEQQPPQTPGGGGGGGGGGNSRNELLLKDLQDAMCWGSIPNSLLGGRAAQEMEIDSLMGPPDPALRSQPSPASGASNEGLLEDIVRPGATRRNM
jgi:hypothetical protein